MCFGLFGAVCACFKIETHETDTRRYWKTHFCFMFKAVSKPDFARSKPDFARSKPDCALSKPVFVVKLDFIEIAKTGLDLEPGPYRPSR